MLSLKSTMLQCLYLDYSYSPGFVQTGSSGPRVLPCLYAGEQQSILLSFGSLPCLVFHSHVLLLHGSWLPAPEGRQCLTQSWDAVVSW